MLNQTSVLVKEFNLVNLSIRLALDIEAVFAILFKFFSLAVLELSARVSGQIASLYSECIQEAGRR